MSRVVLSRELNREEIRHICQHSPIEIEVFGHGALCMGYSGQCYLSAAIGGRSGNRGRCAQPCRQSYGYGRWENKYPLSLKDNCTVRFVRDLEDLGVTSLKLEGRMKRAEYVAAVTQVYRQAIDTGEVTRPMMEQLSTAFNRQGFTDYYTGSIGPRMFGIREEGKDNEKWCKTIRQSYEATENPLVPITLEMTVRRDGSAITVTDPEGRSCSLKGPEPELARKLPLTAEELELRLSKTGGTPYRVAAVHAQIDPDLTLSAAAINGMRRDVLNLLTAHRARRGTITVNKPGKIPQYRGFRSPPELTVQVTTAQQITSKLLKAAPAVLYVPLHILRRNPALCESLTAYTTVCAVLPRVLHDGEIPQIKQDLLAVRDLGVRQVLIGNVGQLLPVRECGMQARGDFGLNLFNSGSVNFVKDLGLMSACLSFEMTLPQIRDVSKALPCELFAYGRLPLMLTENCLIRGRTGQCTCKTGGAKLTDKTGAEFPVVKDGDSCRSVLLNGRKLYWLDRQNDLAQLGLWATRLYFTTENAAEVDRVLTAYCNATPFDPGACTRGLYLRGVE